MNYDLMFTSLALSDIEKHKKSGNKIILKKLYRLFNELREHPKTGIGKPEQLKNDLHGLYSRRIDKKHRLVYKIEEDIVTVLVVSAYAHYRDR